MLILDTQKISIKKNVKHDRRELIDKMMKVCSTVRLLAHTQIDKVYAGSNKGGRQKKLI